MARIKERRKHARFEVNLPAAIQTTSDLVPAQTKNVSAASLRVDYEEPLELDNLVRIFIMPPRQAAIVISGELAWSGKVTTAGAGSSAKKGTCSLTVPMHDRLFLQKVIDLLGNSPAH